MTLVLVCGWLMIIAGVLGCLRNIMVFNYRMRLIDRISAANKQYQYSDWMARWQLFNTVSYSQMMLQFWRPLASFYDEATMLGPNPLGPVNVRKETA